MTYLLKYKPDDIDLLVPSFARVVRLLLSDLVRKGYDPVPRDTLRTQAEAAANARKGSGIRDSMHCHGVAVDIICGRHGWDCAAAKCDFYQALGACVRAYPELVWGGTWTRGGKGPDWPHVQCVTVGEQDRVRSLSRRGGLQVVEAFVAPRLSRYVDDGAPRAMDEECVR